MNIKPVINYSTTCNSSNIQINNSAKPSFGTTFSSDFLMQVEKVAPKMPTEEVEKFNTIRRQILDLITELTQKQDNLIVEMREEEQAAISETGTKIPRATTHSLRKPMDILLLLNKIKNYQGNIET